MINSVFVLIELVYDDVFVVWESIWAASKVASEDFVLFLALAMLECYRDIILDNAMDFTDIIKFFNGRLNFCKIPQDEIYAVKMFTSFCCRNGRTA